MKNPYSDARIDVFGKEYTLLLFITPYAGITHFRFEGSENSVSAFADRFLMAVGFSTPVRFAFIVAQKYALSRIIFLHYQ